MAISFENPYSVGIVDTHAHYDDARFDGYRDELLDELEAFGVTAVINNSTDCYKSAEDCLKMSRRHRICYSAFGVHPLNIEDNGPLDTKRLEKLLRDDKCVALGEIGLDYHYTPETAEKQKDYFCRQLELAKSLDIPVTVHDREAHSDTLEILKKYRPKGTVHCFSGSVESAKEIIGLGMYIGIGGVVTFNNAKKLSEVAKAIPLDRILLETDAPYLAPVPYRGETNHSGMIIRVAEKIASLRGIDAESVLAASKENAGELYGI